MIMWRCLIGKLLLMLLVLASACSKSNEPELTPDSNEESGSKMYLSIKIPLDSDSPVTRADDLHPEEPEYGWDDIYENEINLEDMALYIFSVEKDGSTKLRFYNFNNKYGEMKVDGVFGRYVIVNLDVHKYQGNQDWQIDQSGMIHLKIVLMCNQRGMSGTSSLAEYAYPIANDNTTFSYLVSQSTAQMKQFIINDDWWPRPEGIDTQSIADTKAETEHLIFRHIPMFGYLDVEVPGLDLIKSQPYNRIDLSIMWALRATAKIEIIDDIKRNDGEEYPKIESVNTTGRPLKGCLIPWAAMNNYINGHQVETLSMPQWNYNSTTGTYPYQTLSKIDDLQSFPNKLIWENLGNGIFESRIVSQLFRVYTPEIPKDHLEDLKISITVRFNETKTETYEMNLNKYKDQILFDEDVIRNHIYRISVKSALESTRAGDCEYGPSFEASKL